MDVNSLLDRLYMENVSISAENGQLKLDLSGGKPSEELVKEIKAKKQELLEFLESYDKYESIRPAEERSYYPVSFAQQRLYALYSLDKLSLAYNLPMFYRVRGALDLVELTNLFKEILQRHHILRTTFYHDGEKLNQQINEEVPFSITTNQGKEEGIDRFKLEFVKPFDLSQDPLFRVGAYIFNPEDFILAIDMHHIVSDGISLALLFQEVKSHFEGKNTPSLDIQYKDFAVWERSEATSMQRSNDRSFWLEMYQGEISRLELITDFARPAISDFSGSTVEFKLNHPVYQELKGLCVDENVTLYMVLVSSFSMFLSYYSRQSDITIGTITSGRDREELKPLIGMFANTLALRTFPDSQKTFRTFLHEVKAHCIEAFDHQLYHFDELVDDLGIERDLSRNPLFNVMFILQNMESGKFELGDNEIEFITSENRHSKFDLSLVATERNNELIFQFEYSTNLFREETINMMSQHFLALIKHVVNNPEKKLRNLNLLEQKSVAPRTAGIDDLNTEETLIDLFYSKVDMLSKKVAISMKDNTLSYSELSKLIDKVGHGLHAEGIKKGEVIAVMMDRSIEMIPVILGILRVGAVYLPLDKNNPDERLRYQVEDSQTKLAIVDDDKQRIEGIKSVNFVQLTGVQKSPKEEIVFPTLDDPAYIIYTSGSTGVAKGVLVNHRSLAGLLKSMDLLYPAKISECLLLKTSSVFDVSLSELFGWIIPGTRLEILPQGAESDPFQIIEVIHRTGVTLVNFVPSMFMEFVRVIDDSQKEKIKSVERFILAGEALSLELVKKYQQLQISAKICNLYGPTEATVYATHFQVENFERPTLRVPIGKELAGVEILICNEQGQFLPPGVPGEIYIGGYGVANGYLNQFALTEEKFVSINHHGKLKRFYKSGDLARRLQDGNIEYLGRLDQQVKVRGFRIELGEIEAIIEKFPSINQAAAVVKKPAGYDRLCAYYTATEEVDLMKLKGFLKEHLPYYCIPESLQQLEYFQLGATGKMDRKLLPEPSTVASKLEEIILPQDEEEFSLREIWGATLSLDPVEISTKGSFFSLGGNSLRLIGMLTKINHEFDVDLLLRDLYENKDIQLQAALIRSSAKTKSVLRMIEPKAADEQLAPFPLSNIQFSYWVGRSDNLELGNVSTHSFWSFETKVNVGLANECINQLIHRHPSLRTTILQDGNQITHEEKRYAINLVDISELLQEDQDEIIQVYEAEFARFMFDPQHWPLFEICAMRKNADTYQVFVAIDPIIADAFSMNILKEEFVELYDGKSNLAELSLTFRDYMLQIERLKSTDSFTKAKNYWSNKLEDFPEPPELPLKSTPSEVKTPTFFAHKKFFSKYETKLIQDYAKSRNVSVSAFLLTAYARALAYWSNQLNMGLNLTLFNRFPVHPEINKVVGDFTSLLLLDIRLSSNDQLDGSLKIVQDTLLEALDYRMYDGVEVIRELAKKKGLGRKAVMPIIYTSALFDSSSESTSFEGTIDIDQDRFSSEKGTPTSQVYLDCVVGEQNGRLFTVWNYVDELFDQKTIQSMFDHYLSEIYQAIDPKVDYLNKCIRKNTLLYKGYNATDNPKVLVNTTIHELISQQCKKKPNASALRDQERNFSYLDLENASNKVANYLGEQNVVNGEPVVVIGNRKAETVFLILGVLKAGAVYIPVDPENPAERQESIINQVEAKVILDIEVYDKEIKNSFTSEFNSKSIPPDQPAYVIHTSGSTGVPKGVIINHIGALNTILDINSRFNVNETDRMILISSLGFDLSVYDLFGSLISGAELTILPTNREVGVILDTVIANGITIWNTVPSFWNLMMDTMREDQKLDLRLVLLSGDWIPVSLAKDTILRYPEVSLISLGGATEGSIWSIFFPVNEVNENWKSIPYGYPLDNQQFYVLNYNGQPCPMEIPGQLFIGGEGVLDGYLNDVIKTNNSIIDHPEFGRIYNTGDFGVMKSQGYIEFLGRKDTQVKIRGHRIELGEIEQTINGHHDVAKCLVSNLQLDGRDQLIAYVVPAKEAQSVSSPNKDKMMFQVERNGLRSISEDQPYIQLEENTSTSLTYGSVKNLEDCINFEPSIEQISTILHPLRTFKYGDQNEFSKHFYPSAGSLYPVQLYIRIPKSKDIEGGYYYYYPEEHRLIWLKEDGGERQGTLLYFVGKLDAIEPIYQNKSISFCELEAGHMIQLISSVGSVEGIGFKASEKQESIHNALGMSSEEYVSIVTYEVGSIKSRNILETNCKLEERQSFRTYSEEEVSLDRFVDLVREIAPLDDALEMYIYVQKNYYKFNRLKKAFELVNSGTLPNIYSDENNEMTNQSSFSIFLVTAESTSHNVVIEAGMYGQLLQMELPKKNTGICAVGDISEEINRLLNLKENQKVVYGFVGGVIEEAQKSLQLEKQSRLPLHQKLDGHLKRYLPKYMIPSHIVVIPQFPLTSNGKVDHKNLPVPSLVQVRKKITPSSEMELLLADLFESVLSCDMIGANEDFFDLGGDSLKAMTLIAKINAKQELSISLNDLFSNPTIKELASYIDSVGRVGQSQLDDHKSYFEITI